MTAADRIALRYAGKAILVISGIVAGASGAVHLVRGTDTLPALVSSSLAALYGAFLIWRGRSW